MEIDRQKNDRQKKREDKTFSLETKEKI